MKMGKGGRIFDHCALKTLHLALRFALSLVSRWLLFYLPKPPVIPFSCLLPFQRNRIEYNLPSIISDDLTLLDQP